MFLSLISSHPLFALAWLCAILLSLTIHEFSHALVGKWRGDRTAEREGRLTLNPLAHLDWFGFAAMLLLGFGWAKPVPFNPYNLRDPKWDAVWIGLAGPGSNLFLAAFAGLLLRFLFATGLITSMNLFVIFLVLLVIFNISLALFNIIPIHPLDGFIVYQNKINTAVALAKHFINFILKVNSK